MQVSTQRSQHFRKRLKDFGLYVLISLIVASCPLAAVWFGLSQDWFARWFGFVFFSCLLFGQFIAKSRVLWAKRSFWTMLCIVFVVHVSVFLKLISVRPSLTEGDWMLLGLAELGILVAIRVGLYGKRMQRS